MAKEVEGRRMLKSDRWQEWANEATDQRLDRPRPDFQKPSPAGAILVDLVPVGELAVGQMPLIQAIGRRRSRRQYTSESLTLEELSFLLWATQGLDEAATMAFHEWSAGARPATLDEARLTLRTVPSAGARHPFETYILINRVSGYASGHAGGLEAGLYRYLPLNHKLHFLRPAAGLAEQVKATFAGWQRQAAAIFLWSVIPHRTEWRYSFISPKLIAMDAGHLCQNLYLAAEAIGAGACAVAGYDQEKVDALLGLDGQDEFAIYVAPVGRVDPSVPYHFEH